MMKDKPYLGTDLKLRYLAEPGMYEDADLVAVNRLEKVISKYAKSGKLQNQRDSKDLAPVTGVENIIQALVNRLKTHKGELTKLGHPEYGSRHHELIGELNSDTNRCLLKLYILEALSHESRIEEVLSAGVVIAPSDPTRVDVNLQLKIITVSGPLNLVVPFYFERGGGA
ncbi:MAG: GPW/gp25 family protein [bacterium]|nr:GPW/gp25 family protein [bacterium]